MIDDVFIFDCVIHVYDLSAENTIPRPEAEAGRQSMLAIGGSLRWPGYLRPLSAPASRRRIEGVVAHGLPASRAKQYGSRHGPAGPCTENPEREPMRAAPLLIKVRLSVMDGEARGAAQVGCRSAVVTEATR